MSELTRLTLQPDNPCNTKITDEDGNVLYVVYTEHGKNASTTRVFDPQDHVLAAYVWTDYISSDRVALGDQPLIPLSKWLHKSIIPFVDDVSFKDDKGRKYKWKGNSPGMALQLHTEDDGFKEPIAGFERSRRDPKSDPKNSTWTPAQLLFMPPALEIRDTVILSFLVLERSHRSNEQSKDNLIKGEVALMGGMPLGGY
ncbi:hypothetical protein BKA93DRAFT_72902 [Sparassis latifolia]